MSSPRIVIIGGTLATLGFLAFGAGVVFLPKVSIGLILLGIFGLLSLVMGGAMILYWLASDELLKGLVNKVKK